MRVNEKTLVESKKELNFEAYDNKEYEAKTIINSMVYGK